MLCKRQAKASPIRWHHTVERWGPADVRKATPSRGQVWMHGAWGVFEDQHRGRWPCSGESVGRIGRREGRKVAVAKGQGASCDVVELNYILAIAGAKTCCSKSW